MNRDKKKRYLERYVERFSKIRSCIEEQQRWRDIATNMISGLNEIHCQTTESKVQRSAIEIQTLEEEINKEIELAVEERKKITKIIEEVLQQKSRVLLRKRYLNGMSIREIANELNIAESNVSVSLSKAIDKIEM